jgi:hypothetical protein
LTPTVVSNDTKLLAAAIARAGSEIALSIAQAGDGQARKQRTRPERAPVIVDVSSSCSR